MELGTKYKTNQMEQTEIELGHNKNSKMDKTEQN